MEISLFLKVFNNKFLRSIIFNFVTIINLKNYNKSKIFKYYSIKSLDWVVSNQKWMLLNDMIKIGHKLKVSENSLIIICKKIKNIQDFKSIYELYEEEFRELDFWFIDHACLGGSIEIVKFLHENNYSATFKAVDNACWIGNKEMVEFLLENRKEGLSKDSIDGAASNGHLEIVEMLTKRYPNSNCCSKSAMNQAVKNGHFEIVKYLHKNHTEGCLTVALEYCCKYGYSEIYKYLYENDILSINNKNQPNYIIFDGLEKSVIGGHLNMVKYLIETKLTSSLNYDPIYRLSLTHNNMEIIKFLEKYSNKEISKDDFLVDLKRVISNQLIENINYLFDQFSTIELTLKDFKSLIFFSINYSNSEILKIIFNKAIKKYPILNNFKTNLNQLYTYGNNNNNNNNTIPPIKLKLTIKEVSLPIQYNKNQLNEKKLFLISIKQLDLEKTKFIYQVIDLFNINNINIALCYCIYNLNLQLTEFLINNLFGNTFTSNYYLLSPIIKRSPSMYNYLLKFKSNDIYENTSNIDNNETIFINDVQDLNLFSNKYFNEFHILNEKLYKESLEKVSIKLLSFSKRCSRINNIPIFFYHLSKNN